LSAAPHILIVEMEAFNKDQGGKRFKLNKPMPLSVNIDHFILPSVDSNKEVPEGNYKLIAAICIDGKKDTKYSYYTLVLKNFQRLNT
jgi:ubiquitin C-terminal hydrolase